MQTLTQARQAAYYEYCNYTSAQTWSTYSKLRNQLSKVLKEKQKKFAWSCFSSLCSAKERWKFINTALGQNIKSANLAAVRNSFGKMIVDDKEMADHFNLIFSNLIKISVISMLKFHPSFPVILRSLLVQSQ